MPQAGLLLSMFSPAGPELCIIPHGTHDTVMSYMQYSSVSVDISTVINGPVSIQSYEYFHNSLKLTYSLVFWMHENLKWEYGIVNQCALMTDV